MAVIHIDVSQEDRKSLREILDQNPEITWSGGGKATSGTFYVEESDFTKLQRLCAEKGISTSR